MTKFSSFDLAQCRDVLDRYAGIDRFVVRSCFALGFPPPISLIGFDVPKNDLDNARLFSRVMRSFGIKIPVFIHRRLVADGTVAKDFYAFPLSDLVDNLEIEILKNALFKIFEIEEK